MQLLKITTTPIEYKLQVENASLKVTENTPAKIDPQTPLGKLSIKSENIKVQLDTSRARDSVGIRKVTDVMKTQGFKGMQAAQTASAQYAQLGEQLSQIQNGATVGTVFAQMMTKQPETAMVFIPSCGADISWKPNSLEIKYEPAKVKTEWQAAKFTMEFVPSRYKMDILQYPKVEIEYIGGPMYVPPSANPNYNG